MKKGTNTVVNNVVLYLFTECHSFQLDTSVVAIQTVLYGDLACLLLWYHLSSSYALDDEVPLQKILL